MYDDTIAAVATPPGDGGIAVIRLSGPESAGIAASIFTRGRHGRRADVTRLESHRLYYGQIVEPVTDSVVDEVMLVRMTPPHTYTREDVVEIHCHGGSIPVKRILALCIANGARLAHAGEFTLRAFINGRIDLSQAEAVMAVVSSRTDQSLALAVDELQGGLTRRLSPVRDALIETLAFLDASADFPEDEVPPTDLRASLRTAEQVLCDVLQSSNLGMLYHEGIHIAIVGRPNVGKSSLMNRLLRSERAIVTDIAGTTRDVITESMNLRGIPATLHDTAGIAETEDVIELMGIDRSRKALETASLVLLVADGSQQVQPDDLAVARLLAERLQESGLNRVLVVINKIDLPRKLDLDAIRSVLIDSATVQVSTLTGSGIDALESTLFERAVGMAGDAREPATVSLRQRDALRGALEAVKSALASLDARTPIDLIAIDVRDALLHIGEITGERVSESVLDEIFSRFCIGK